MFSVGSQPFKILFVQILACFGKLLLLDLDVL